MRSRNISRLDQLLRIVLIMYHGIILYTSYTCTIACGGGAILRPVVLRKSLLSTIRRDNYNLVSYPYVYYCGEFKNDTILLSPYWRLYLITFTYIAVVITYNILFFNVLYFRKPYTRKLI